MHKNSNFQITGYTAYPCKCTNCRGIISYVRNDLTCDVKDICHMVHPSDIHHLTVWYGNNKIQLYNIYSPPGKVFNFPEMETTFHKTVLSGDFNGHSRLWGYRDTNDTGRKIEELCASTNLMLLQDENSPPTLLHKAHGTLHRPDLTLVSADLEQHCTEELLRDTASDHRPILTKINILKRRNRKRRTRWNFKKANWNRYRQESDQLFQDISLEEMDVENLSDTFNSICLKASILTIPRGCTPNFRPFWNAKLEEATKARNLARQKYEEDPSIENRRCYNEANLTTKVVTKESKQENWRSTCEP